MVTARTQLWLSATVALIACAPAPAPTACLTSRDCAPAERCVAGTCTLASTLPDSDVSTDAAVTDVSALLDVGSLEDGGEADDAGLVDDAAPTSDADPEDASASDAGLGPDATGPSGEDCTHASVVAGSVGEHVVRGTLAAAVPDYGTICVPRAARRPGQVFVIDLPGVGFDVDLRVTAGFDTQIALSTECDDSDPTGTFFDCSDDANLVDHDTRLLLHRYAYDRVYLLVTTLDAGDGGDFELRASISAADDTSTCSTTRLALTGGGKVLGWVRGSDSSPHASCVDSSLIASNETFAYVGDADGTLANISAYFGAATLGLSVWRNCRSGAFELSCREGTTASLSSVGTPAGITHYIEVNGIPDGESRFYSLYVLP